MSSKYIRSITEMIPEAEDLPSLTPMDETVSNSNTFLGLSVTAWIIIILLLALIGFNIFSFLAKGTEATVSILEPLLKLIGYTTLETTKQVVQTTAEGTKTGVNLVADTTTTAIDTIVPPKEDSLDKALNNAKMKTASSAPSPDDAQSAIQYSGKSGWCYIGTEKGIRSCAEVGVNDIRMSGDIFPTQEVCMNPKLRA